MLGLDEKSLWLSFDAAVYDYIKRVKGIASATDEMLEFHQDEHPITAEVLKKLMADFGRPDLSLEEYCYASFLALLKVIQLNNIAIEKQLHEAGFSL